MWRSLSSPGPLFGCLPQSVADRDPSQIMVLHQYPQPDHLLRLRKYASFVQKLSLKAYKGVGIRPIPPRKRERLNPEQHTLIYSVLIKRPASVAEVHPTAKAIAAIISALDSDVLLPNLRELTCECVPSLTFALLPHIVARKLSSLNYKTKRRHEDDAAVTDWYADLTVLKALRQQTPQLSSLAITCHPLERPTNLFVDCDTLKSLHLSSVDHGIVKAIARFPQLQELHIAFPFSVSFDTSAFLERPFASLSSLTISEGVDSTIISFLSLVSAVSLTTVTIRSKCQFPLRSLCESLSKHGAKMRQLKIEAERTDLTCQDVEPLLSCRNLVAVCLIPSSSVKLDGACLARMAKAWPLLQELWIRTADARSKHDFPLALADLEAFAYWTPCLRRLSIDLDATRVAALPELDERCGLDETPRNPRSALPYLNVGYSPIADAAADAVASILSTWFPGLQAVGYLRRYPEQQYGFDGWARVMDKVSGGRQSPASVVRSVFYP